MPLTDKSAPVSLPEIDSGRATLKLLSKDINQIALVGKAVVVDGKRELSGEFKAMYASLSPTLADYMTKFETCLALAISKGQEDLFPTNDDIKLRNEVKRLAYKAEEYHQSLTSAPAASSENLNSKSVFMNQTSARSRLPSIPIPKFSGNLADWPRFKQLFLSMVHTNDELVIIEKYYFLADALQGEAKALISSFGMDEENYEAAWKVLLQRYDNKRLLATSYVDKVLDYPAPKGPCTLKALQAFIAVVAENATALRNVDIPNEADFLWLTLALRKLDPDTRRQFETKYVGVEWPSFQNLTDFVHAKSRIWQLSDCQAETTSTYTRPSRPTIRPRILATTSKDTSPPKKTSSATCFCSDNHRLWECSFFRAKSPSRRRAFLRGKNVCFNCLQSGHFVSSCPSSGRCRTCRAKHHTLLHDALARRSADQQQEQPGTHSESAEPAVQASPLCGSVTGPAQVLLGTAVVHVADAWGTPQPVRLLLDCGSQVSLMTTSCARRLGLTWEATRSTPLGAGQTPLPGVKGQLRCRLVSRIRPDHHVDARPIVVDEITGPLPSSPVPPHLGLGLSPAQLADPTFQTPSPIDFLLGSDLFLRILTQNETTEPSAFGTVSTIFGIVLMGSTDAMIPPSDSACHLICDSQPLPEIMTRFWEVEEVPPSPLCSASRTDPAEEHFLRTHTRCANGRYSVALPFKEPSPIFPGVRILAHRRFLSLEAKLSKNPGLRAQYCDFMKEYEALGHMTPTNESSAYVIPHHAVVRADSAASGIRVVFDASMKTNAGSLNDKLHIGRKLQHDISDVILRFRRHVIPICTDIVKMYRQIQLHASDRRYQHILWRSSQNEALRTFRLNTVTYGTSSAPFAAIRTLQQLAEDEGAAFPRALPVLLDDIYVDDIVTGASTIEDAKTLVNQLIALLAKGQFTVHKWQSSSAEFLQTLGLDAGSNSKLVLDSRDHEVTKILGMAWEASSDSFFFSVRLQDIKTTKRSILSTIARLYDPLGLVAPVIFRAKCLLQRAWNAGLAWDDPVHPPLESEWTVFARQLPHIQRLRIPRYMLVPQIQELQLLGFCDASQKGFAAAFYLRAVSTTGASKVTLLRAKTKLAPLKTVSIPRLELCAAHLLIKLLSTLDNLRDILAVQELFLFTDSTIVLAWLGMSPHLLQTFVANRVAFILTHSDPARWFHVSSRDNPADLASRGCLPVEIQDNQLWWEGPHWLHRSPLQIPQAVLSAPPQDLLEFRSTAVTLAINEDFCWLSHWMSKHSRYLHMVRSLAYVFKFITVKKIPNLRSRGSLSPQDLETALSACIRATQRQFFREDFNWTSSTPQTIRLRKLDAFLDPLGLLRVGGRLHNSALSYDNQHPIILPGNSHLVRLMIDHYHHAFFHLNHQALQAYLLKRYYIFNLRIAVRSRLIKCLTCFRLRAQPSHPFMAPLPSPRVTQVWPFASVGVDYAGPFSVKLGTRRNSPLAKAYLALFVCLATKAVHLELVQALSADAFLAAFDRFIARRGLPQKVFSDCGRNFVSAARHLREVQEWLADSSNQKTIANVATNKGITWQFIPPYAPHFGGIWEAAVKSTKYHLLRVVKHQSLTFEELTTLFSRIEAVLNSRPLCPIHADPPFGDFLTPGHFLIGRPLTSVPEPDITQLPLNHLSRWQLISRAVQHFWKRWSSEYLHTLQRRPKWYTRTAPVKPGDLVLIIDPSSPPLRWKTGRIIHCHPGPDGITRVVTLQSSGRTYRRALSRLVPLFHISTPSAED